MAGRQGAAVVAFEGEHEPIAIVKGAKFGV
jgi:hypothetical protein